MIKSLQILWLFASLVIADTSSAQSYIQNWAIQIGGKEWDLIHTTKLDQHGNIYLGGQFIGAATFENYPASSKKDNDSYICKIDSSGTIQKVKLISGSSFNRINSIVNYTSNVYVTGTCRDSIQINPLSHTIKKNRGLFIAHLDQELEPKKIHIPVFGPQIHISSCESDQEGNILICGYYRNWISVNDSIIHSSIRKEFFILKMGMEGDVSWIRTWPTRNIKFSPTIRTTRKNEVIFAGSFNKKLEFTDTTIFSKGKTDLFIENLDSNGKTQWIRTFGGVMEDLAGPITIDTIGNIYASGEFTNRIVLKDRVYTSSGESDLFLVKLDPHGNYIWSKQLSGNRGKKINAITSNNKGDLFSILSFKGSILINEDTISSFDRQSDILFLKFESNGEYQWAKQFFGNSEDLGHSVLTDPSNNIILSGSFSSDLNMDQKNFNSKGIKDIFLAKYFDPCSLGTFNLPDVCVLCADEVDTLDAGEGFTDYSWEGTESCERYLEVSEPGYYTATVIDKYGCRKRDSILVITDTIMIEFSVINEVLPEGNNGSINTTIMGLSDQISYLWNTGDTTPDLTRLSQGTYSLTVKDEFNCYSSNEVSVGQDVSSGILSLTNYPNPFNEITNIIYSIPNNMRLDISLFDMNGKKLFNILHVTQKVGEHQFEWNRRDLPSGVYYLQIKTKDGIISRKILITDL